MTFWLPTESSSTVASRESPALARYMAVPCKAESRRRCVTTMRQLCERLHLVPEASAAEELAAWRTELHTLHGHLHEKVEDYLRYPICGDEGGGNRLRHGVRQKRQEWSSKARADLWQATQDFVRKYGVRWAVWQAIPRAVPAPAPLPPELQQESIPWDKIRELDDGTGYAWGDYTSICQKKEDAYADLKRQY